MHRANLAALRRKRLWPLRQDRSPIPVPIRWTKTQRPSTPTLKRARFQILSEPLISAESYVNFRRRNEVHKSPHACRDDLGHRVEAGKVGRRRHWALKYPFLFWLLPTTDRVRWAAMSAVGHSLQVAFGNAAGQVRTDPKADLILKP